MGFSEMIFIFFFALIVFGPKRLPEIGRQVGKLMAEFKRHSNEFKSQLENEIRQMELQEAVKKMDAEMPKILPPQKSIPTVTEYLKSATALDLEAKPVIESPAVLPAAELAASSTGSLTSTPEIANAAVAGEPGPLTEAKPAVPEPPIKAPDA
jgi:sec-independent protein translocase protein TatB